MTLVVAAVILLLGRAFQAFDAGHSAAVLMASLITVASWWLVQRWGMHNLYELVPAFVLATTAALAVSRVVPDRGE